MAVANSLTGPATTSPFGSAADPDDCAAAAASGADAAECADADCTDADDCADAAASGGDAAECADADCPDADDCADAAAPGADDCADGVDADRLRRSRTACLAARTPRKHR